MRGTNVPTSSHPLLLLLLRPPRVALSAAALLPAWVPRVPPPPPSPCHAAALAVPGKECTEVSRHSQTLFDIGQVKQLP